MGGECVMVDSLPENFSWLMTLLARFIFLTLLGGIALVACQGSDTPTPAPLAVPGQPTLVFIYTDA